MLMRTDSKSRFGVVATVFATTIAAQALADTPNERDYWAAAIQWATQLGVTDRCYNEFSKDKLEAEAEAGAAAMHPGLWAGISGSRQDEADQLVAAMVSAHAAGFASKDPCFMSLMLRDASQSLADTMRRAVELENSRD